MDFEQDINNSVEPELDYSYIKNLSKIYLQKTCYNIKNQKVEQLRDLEIQPPKTLIEEVSFFESGQVYEIVYKDTFTGNFMTNNDMIERYKESNKTDAPREINKFLIYTVT